MTDNEDRYEAIEMIVKTRSDGQSWFDMFFDMITETCEGNPESEENSCTCGLESMGGSSGTLDQCYRHQGIADDLVGPVKKEDLVLLLDYVRATGNTQPFDVRKAAERLRKECTWWDDIKASWDDEEEEDEDE